MKPVGISKHFMIILKKIRNQYILLQVFEITGLLLDFLIILLKLFKYINTQCN